MDRSICTFYYSIAVPSAPSSLSSTALAIAVRWIRGGSFEYAYGLVFCVVSYSCRLVILSLTLTHNVFSKRKIGTFPYAENTCLDGTKILVVAELQISY